MLRPARLEDVPAIFHLIQALADYEQLSQAVVGNSAALATHLFSARSYVEAVVAEVDGRVIGFALFLPTYTAKSLQPGLYLEDLFVLPEYRGQGIGKALLQEVYRLAHKSHCSRLEWSVLDWNQPAIAFYQKMGATIRADLRICRLTGSALAQVAASATASPIRFATSAEVPQLLQWLQISPSVLQTNTNPEATLRQHLFESPAYAEAIVLEQAGQLIGGATFFHNYSTFLTQPGISIDHLATQHQSLDLELTLLTQLAQVAVQRQCGRLEWVVRATDSASVARYEALGATVLPDWWLCQVSAETLATRTSLKKEDHPPLLQPLH